MLNNMFYFKLLLIFLVLRSTKSDLTETFGKVFEKVKQTITGGDNDIKKDVNNDSIPTSLEYERKEAICSFVKLEKPSLPEVDEDECSKINGKYRNSENYNVLDYFGNVFDSLKEGLDSVKLPTDGNKKMTTVFFVGNTGSGKSTVVQILGSDNSKITSESVNSKSEEYIIVDDSKIGMDTVTSQTLYTDLLVDPDTSYVLCDNPGFRDTRSSVHEIIAMYSMRKILKNTDKLKLVIVSTHASLQKGMYRDDFPNLLKHVTDFFKNLDKFQKGIFLIGTKVENKVTMVKGKIQLVSDETTINNIAYFLKEVKTSLNDKNFKINVTTGREEFIKKSSKIIDFLLAKNLNSNYSQINIMRRPMEPGPISENEIIQSQRQNIRQMLLNDNNFIKIDQNDFGYTLTDTAKVYLDDTFKRMNDYVTIVSELISNYVLSYYEKIVNTDTDVNDMLLNLMNIKSDIKLLSENVGRSKDPGDYTKTIENFSDKYNLKINCLNSFKNISTLHNYLKNLEDLSNTIKYTPLSWNRTILTLIDFFDTKSDEFEFIKGMFMDLSSHKFQKARRSFNVGSYITEKKSSDPRFNLLDFNSKFLKDKMNYIINITSNHKPEVVCASGKYVVIDYIINLSEIIDSLSGNCLDAEEIVILALHTLYLDKNLEGKVFEGKDLTIIAGVWDVVGSVKISVNGADGGEKLPKATQSGVIGKSGLNGNPGGRFVGIGMKFNNDENLEISACGGSGQDGQDGGDGRDGSIGSHGTTGHEEFVDTTSKGFFLQHYQDKYIARGSQASDGEDAGAGGKGGFGGLKGSAKMYIIGNYTHNIKIVTDDGPTGSDGKDGKPGRQGIRGCDLAIMRTKSYLLGILPWGSDESSYHENCNMPSKPGGIKRQTHTKTYNNQTISKEDNPVCLHIMTFQNYYLGEYNTGLNDGLIRDFINGMKSVKF